MTADPLPLYWWVDEPNFGDRLSPVIVGRLLGRPVIHATHTTPKLLAIGSILQQYSVPGDVIWGTGAWFGHEDWSARGITCLAVRGPRTRDYVLRKGGRCPEIYGDPALLLPHVHPVTLAPTRDLAILPHYADEAGWNIGHQQGLYTINPGWPWERIVQELANSARVVTSSLHGLIACEAYGIPVTWATFLPPAKFHDYYLGVGRPIPKPLPWPAAIGYRPPAIAPQAAPPALLPALLDWVCTT